MRRTMSVLIAAAMASGLLLGGSVSCGVKNSQPCFQGDPGSNGCHPADKHGHHGGNAV